MYRLINLTKIYNIEGKRQIKALNGINVDFPNKGLVFINGKSGCGKTTLLNLLGGLDSFDEGELLFGDNSLKNFSSTQLGNYRKDNIGFIFQDSNLLEVLTVGENIALASKIQKNKVSKAEIEKLLNSVGLNGYFERKGNKLSGGEKQRVAIARALYKNSKVILADEPSGNLDSKTSYELFMLLKSISISKLVIVVSHDLEYSKKFANRIITLADGKILSDIENRN